MQVEFSSQRIQKFKYSDKFGFEDLKKKIKQLNYLKSEFLTFPRRMRDFLMMIRAGENCRKEVFNWAKFAKATLKALYRVQNARNNWQSLATKYKVY